MVIVTGAKGQLGTDVVLELERRGIEYIGIDIDELDITDASAVSAFFRRLVRINKQVRVIHCAAYTAVDKAEDEAELCYKVNVEGTKNIAKICREIGAEMMYISTDYVFGGEGDVPYETDAPKNPLGVYAKSKHAGEEAVIEALDKYYIVRISWVFGENGPNFVRTMLRLAESNDVINVVSDQIGSPTYTADLAGLLCDIIISGKYGTYHATNEGLCSWAEFAEEIMRLRHEKADSNRRHVKINHISTEQYSTKAQRPKNSRLSKKSLDDAGFTRLPTWQDALKRYIHTQNPT